MRFIKRYAWGARKPRRAHYEPAHDSYLLELPATVAVISYTMSEPCYDEDHCMKCLRDIQHRNIYKYALHDIRYNFVLDRQGNVYMCRGWRTIPSLPQRYRYMQKKALYIAYIGFQNNNINEAAPPESMIRGKESLLREAVTSGYLSPKFLELNI